jgi:hypothetical protein
MATTRALIVSLNVARRNRPTFAGLVDDERMSENEGTRNRRAKRAELGSAPYGRVWPHQSWLNLHVRADQN